ncbi:putative membrane protein YizD [Lentibacillus sp. JNUCC-1]|uniref:hypothetical protein n=1 Tax=Lentibacillus sp. JNUCC-1 TaxID=2654513 RepID=UPI0012E7B463|nr:hypothetical protein [Lentibacillus sp. JNUCC-1]MUV36512.1 putative membrane protein YizD [Lentibacillus sp. JNUCC-1]
MQELYPVIFFLLTVVAFVLNIFGLMQLIPLYITLPLLFIAIYATIFTFAHRKTYRGKMR